MKTLAYMYWRTTNIQTKQQNKKKHIKENSIAVMGHEAYFQAHDLTMATKFFVSNSKNNNKKIMDELSM